MNSGLVRYNALLNPDAVSEIRGWQDDPELSRLLTNLQANGSERGFFNTYAEALVARFLLRRGCALRVEVPTPSGRTCDFEVERDGVIFHLHVKRVDTDRPVRRRLTISSRLRYLERITRPYIVSVGWHEGLNDQQMQAFVRDAAQFIQHARVGDEHIVRDEDGTRLGRCRIVAPWQGSNVSLVIGLPEGFVDETLRMRKLMGKAYRQFMPQSTNVIMVCSGHAEDAADFETALLGSHVERWDRLPAEGRRIAHGRDADGFWYNSRHADSAVVSWFRFEPDQDRIHPRIWRRDGVALDEDVAATLESIFGEMPLT